MQIENIKIEQLKEYENNPRFNDAAVDAVAASIREFGFRVPIVVDAENVIIAGHTRLKAAKKLGMEIVPCIKAEDMNPDQVKAFRLADNKTGELAGWDFTKLEEELAEMDFDMEEFGFKFEEVAEDIEPIDDEELAGSDIVQHTLVLDRQKIILTDEEYEQFKSKIDEFVSDNGVTFGFVRWLLNG